MAAAIPLIKPQYLDKNGKPLAGGKLFFYQAGTLTPMASYTDSFGTVPNTNPVILDSSGRGDIWLIPGSYKIVLKNANDEIIWTKDNVKPADGGGGGLVDGDYSFNIYSLHYNESFISTGLMDTLTKMLKPGYLAHNVSLTGSSNTLREKGVTVSGGITLTASIQKNTDPIKEVRFYRNPSTLLSTQTSGGAIPGGGTSTQAYAPSFSDDVTFRVEVDDDGTTGGPTTKTATTTYTFVYPYFWGSGATGSLTAANIAAKTKDIRASQDNITRNFVVSGGNYFYFAQPAGYPVITKIYDINNFEVQGGFNSFVGNYTANDGTTQALRVYVNTAPIGVDTLLRYVR